MRNAGALRRSGALRRRRRRSSLNSVRRWGRMSAHKWSVDLSDGFRMVIGGKAAQRRTSPFHRNVVKRLCLYAPRPWPLGIMYAPRDRAGSLAGNLPRRLPADADDRRRVLIPPSPATRSRPASAHPILLWSLSEKGMAPLGRPATSITTFV